MTSIKKGSVAAHPITIRYAEYAAALRRLNVGYDDEVLEICLIRLQKEEEALLDVLGDKVGSMKGKHAFMVNNCDIIIRTLMSKNLDCIEIKRFSDVLQSHVSTLIEMELNEKFSKLIAFVKAVEPQVQAQTNAAAATTNTSGGNTPTPTNATANTNVVVNVNVNDDAVEAIVRGFISTWSNAMEDIANNIRKFFQRSDQVLTSAATLSISSSTGVTALSPDTDPYQIMLMSSTDAPDTGSEVLKKALLQVVFYYKRFYDLLHLIYARRQPVFFRDLVSIQSVLYKIKEIQLKSGDNSQ